MSVVGGVMSAISSFFDILFKYAAIVGAYFLGKRRAEAEHMKELLEVKDEQAKVDARPNLHWDVLLDRMRRRKRK